MTAAIRRLVSGAIAFRSTRSRRSLSARARSAISTATDSATSGGTIDRSTDDSRTTASRSGRSSIPALSASSIVLALRLAAVPTTRAPPRRRASATALPIAPGLTIPTVATRNESTSAQRRSARTDTSRGGAGRAAERACRPGVRSAASTSLRRDPGPSSPTRSGDVVTNSSSTAPAWRKPPKVCGPASQRIRRWPLAWSARRTTSGAMRRPGPSATTVDAEGTRPSRCSAPASLVRTSAPDASSGCPTSISPLPVRTATSGRGRRSQALSELCVFRGRGRKDPVWPPGPSWACAKHSGADEHGVRERAQQTHYEPIRVAVPGDELVRTRHRRNRDDAIDGRDEIGVHAVLGEPEIAVVESRELRRQRGLWEPVRFVQELERRK